MSDIKIKLKIPSFKAKLMRHLKMRMSLVVTGLESWIKERIGTSNQGGKNPSMPGEMPHAGTGTLKKSITNKVIVSGGDIVGVYGVAKGPASPYARRLELGFTGKDSRGRVYDMKPRPFLKPAYQKNKQTIIRTLVK